MDICMLDQMDRSIFEQNYKNLLALIPESELWSLNAGDALKSRSSGYMDLNLDVLIKEADKMIIALSHYYKHPSGDMIADPDVEVKVWKQGVIAALSYQDSYTYYRVNDFDSNLNDFLATWLKQCLLQGHRLKMRDFECAQS